MGMKAYSNAPRAGETTIVADWTMPSCPLILVISSSGTMVGRIDWIVGIWNAWAGERTKSETKTSQSGKVEFSVPTTERMTAKAAATRSGTMSRAFLFHRSMKVPTKGLSNTIGSMASSVA
jgi:hypothetical protein